MESSTNTSTNNNNSGADLTHETRTTTTTTSSPTKNTNTTNNNESGESSSFMNICAGCKRNCSNLLACDDCVSGSPGSASHPNDQRFCAQCMIGRKVRVFWPVDQQWYVGIVQRYDEQSGEHELKYPDGDTEWVKIGDTPSNMTERHQQQQQLQLEQQQHQQHQVQVDHLVDPHHNPHPQTDGEVVSGGGGGVLGDLETVAAATAGVVEGGPGHPYVSPHRHHQHHQSYPPAAAQDHHGSNPINTTTTSPEHTSKQHQQHPNNRYSGYNQQQQHYSPASSSAAAAVAAGYGTPYHGQEYNNNTMNMTHPMAVPNDNNTNSNNKAGAMDVDMSGAYSQQQQQDGSPSRQQQQQQQYGPPSHHHHPHHGMGAYPTAATGAPHMMHPAYNPQNYGGIAPPPPHSYGYHNSNGMLGGDNNMMNMKDPESPSRYHHHHQYNQSIHMNNATTSNLPPPQGTVDTTQGAPNNTNHNSTATPTTTTSNTTTTTTNTNTTTSKRKSGPKTWTKEEDDRLLQMVTSMRMPMKWSIVAQSMPDRTGKQCRERYVNHLNPRLKSSEWSPIEDATIFHLYNTSGSQWAKMSKMIPGRTDNGIKNRFHNLRRQLEREDEHRLRLSKPEEFTEDIHVYRLRQGLPEHLRGKSDGLWDMHKGIGILAAQSVINVNSHHNSTASSTGGGINRNPHPHHHNNSKFGPFRLAKKTGEQCSRCGLIAPSVQCGTEICTKSGWCQTCTKIPPHIGGNMLRECLNLRKTHFKSMAKQLDVIIAEKNKMKQQQQQQGGQPQQQQHSTTGVY